MGSLTYFEQICISKIFSAVCLKLVWNWKCAQPGSCSPIGVSHDTVKIFASLIHEDIHMPHCPCIYDKEIYYCNISDSSCSPIQKKYNCKDKGGPDQLRYVNAWYQRTKLFALGPKNKIWRQKSLLLKQKFFWRIRIELCNITSYLPCATDKVPVPVPYCAKLNNLQKHNILKVYVRMFENYLHSVNNNTFIFKSVRLGDSSVQLTSKIA